MAASLEDNRKQETNTKTWINNQVFLALHFFPNSFPLNQYKLRGLTISTH